ncbi:MAG: hypothetical protein IJF27_02360 [Oscillospiraceae bacterium]|nr:hypothetical protein [Oscillospiraceae bacterium]
MEDISKAIDEILGSDEGRNNLKNIAAMFGLELPDGLADNSSDGASRTEPSADMPFGGIDIDTIFKISQLMQKLNGDDDNTRLLKALKPHLKNDKKIDEAIKLLRLISLLPELKQLGLFGGLL